MKKHYNSNENAMPQLQPHARLALKPAEDFGRRGLAPLHAYLTGHHSDGWWPVHVILREREEKATGRHQSPSPRTPPRAAYIYALYVALGHGDHGGRLKDR